MSKEYDLLENIKEKLSELNSGVLNPSNAPDWLPVERLNELGILSLKLGSVINELKSSSGTLDDLRNALREIEQIEKDASYAASYSANIASMLSRPPKRGG